MNLVYINTWFMGVSNFANLLVCVHANLFVPSNYVNLLECGFNKALNMINPKHKMDVWFTKVTQISLVAIIYDCVS
jgi:hypothetical protein